MKLLDLFLRALRYKHAFLVEAISHLLKRLLLPFGDHIGIDVILVAGKLRKRAFFSYRCQKGYLCLNSGLNVRFLWVI